jgi:GntR family transcriptional repressor for pyruvate dehydrogenase complex
MATSNTGSLVDIVVCNLTDDILSQKIWKPGDRLPNEMELAERYNVSRNTMREAIKILNANNILETKPRSGTYVVENPGIDDDPFGFNRTEEKMQLMLDMYEMRSIVESAAAKMVVERATDEEIMAICHQEEVCRELLLAGKHWSEADRAFHAAIAHASHNMAFYRIIPSIHQSAYLGYTTIDTEKNKKNTLHYHPLIAECIRRRDALGAILAIRYHMRQSADDLRSTLLEPEK